MVIAEHGRVPTNCDNVLPVTVRDWVPKLTVAPGAKLEPSIVTLTSEQAGGSAARTKPTVAVPTTDGVCTEAAVTFTDDVLPEGVRIPDEEIVPLEVDQLTAVEKLPVPRAVAAHWLVCPSA